MAAQQHQSQRGAAAPRRYALHAPRGTSRLMLALRAILNLATSSLHSSDTVLPATLPFLSVCRRLVRQDTSLPSPTLTSLQNAAISALQRPVKRIRRVQQRPRGLRTRAHRLDRHPPSRDTSVGPLASPADAIMIELLLVATSGFRGAAWSCAVAGQQQAATRASAKSPEATCRALGSFPILVGVPRSAPRGMLRAGLIGGPQPDCNQGQPWHGGSLYE